MNITEKGMTTHASISITGLLRLGNKQLKALFSMNGKDAREELLTRKRRGELLIKEEGCDNFDPKKGCIGHPIKPKEA